MRPTVSVIIPAYNRGNLVGRAIDSALSQTFCPHEVIVVDDGSVDDTPAVANRYGHRIIYIRQANQGAAAARNVGVQRAQGDLIAFLDADDYWLADKLAEQIPLFDRPEIGFVHCGCRILQKDYEWQMIGPPSSALTGWCLRDYLESYAIMTPAVVMRRNVFERTGAFDTRLRYSDDLDMWARAALVCQWGYVQKVLVVVDWHREDLAYHAQTRDAWRGYAIFDRYARFVRFPGAWAWRRRCRAKMFYMSAIYHLRLGNFSKAVRYGCRGALESPRTADWGCVKAICEGIITGIAGSSAWVSLRSTTRGVQREVAPKVGGRVFGEAAAPQSRLDNTVDVPRESPMTRDTVSVVIPCYNGQGFLRESIGSVLSQTSPVLEIIVVDDGSTDDSAQVAAGFGPPVRIIRQAHKGLPAARNTGIAAARGDWLAFLDADDRWLPRKLEAQLTKAREGHDLIYTDARDFGDSTFFPQTRAEYHSLPQGGVFPHLVLDNFVVISSVMVRRTCIGSSAPFDERLSHGCEDWDLWLRLSQRISFGCVREPLVEYRRHPGQMSRKAPAMAKAQAIVLRRAAGLPLAADLSPAVLRLAWAQAYHVVALMYEAVGAYGSAIRYSCRSVGLCPQRIAFWKSLARGSASLILGGP